MKKKKVKMLLNLFCTPPKGTEKFYSQVVEDRNYGYKMNQLVLEDIICERHSLAMLRYGTDQVCRLG